MSPKQFTSVSLSNGTIINIEVIRSKRARHISLKANLRGFYAVVPTTTDEPDIAKFVESRNGWISNTVSYFEKLTRGLDPRLIQQDKLLLLGTPYDLQVVKDRYSYVIVSENLNRITVHSPDKQSYREAIFNFYREQTSRILNERLRFFSSKLNLEYFNRISIKYQRSRWGSCSFKKNLNFNVMLSALPHDVVDYVIIHELLHLLELNHSRKFWTLVRLNHPRYFENRTWLRRYGPFIRIPERRWHREFRSAM
jgi:predicted metal-dependent hydrolase